MPHTYYLRNLRAQVLQRHIPFRLFRLNIATWVSIFTINAYNATSANQRFFFDRITLLLKSPYAAERI